MPKESKKQKFKSGIYNYCDRWCEKCKDKNRCLLYEKEQKRQTQNLAKGDDLNDLEVIMRYIARDLRNTKNLLNEKIKELGMDNDFASVELAEPNFDEHPLVQKSSEYFELTHKFLNEFFFDQQKFTMQYGVVVKSSDIENELETITWYHTLLPNKTWRLIYDLYEFDQEQNPSIKSILKKDLPKILALVQKCLTHSDQAIKSFMKKRNNYTKYNHPMLELLKSIKSDLDKLK
ncbi:MAG: hypothetical protein Q8Q23_01515 [bacterium]|nr:hypothetical protein [bacterium]